MSTTNENRIAPDQRANITTPELLVLYSRLEAVTAQRDQCREALREASCCNVLLSNHIVAGSDYFPERQAASSDAIRAALLACEGAFVAQDAAIFKAGTEGGAL